MICDTFHFVHGRRLLFKVFSRDCRFDFYSRHDISALMISLQSFHTRLMSCRFYCHKYRRAYKSLCPATAAGGLEAIFSLASLRRADTDILPAFHLLRFLKAMSFHHFHLFSRHSYQAG